MLTGLTEGRKMERADKKAIANWFSTWEKLIGRVDYALARDLFDSDVIGFGTHGYGEGVRPPGTGSMAPRLADN